MPPPHIDGLLTIRRARSYSLCVTVHNRELPDAHADRPVLAVLCADGDRPPHMAQLDGRMDVRYTETAGLATALDGADALLLWDFFSTALHDVWDHAGTLRWIHVAAAGVDKLLFDELVQSDITVTNARGIFDRPIAEFVLLNVLAHAKQAARSMELQRDRQWQHRDTARVDGARALVIGTGSIGREIARLLRAIDVEVTGAGRTERTGDRDFGTVIASSNLAAHVGQYDYVVLVAPLTEQTRGLIDRDVLQAMKPTGYLINVGRGECVVEADLLDALNSGAISGAALDVFNTEPLPADHPLWEAPGVTISAHMAGDANDWIERLAYQFLDNAERYLDGQPLLNVIDKQLGFAAPDATGSR